LSKAINAIDISGDSACALVFDLDHRFLDVLTDGDIRRAFLSGLGLSATVGDIRAIKLRGNRTAPVVANILSTHDERVKLFQDNDLRQLVLVDDCGSPRAVISHKSIDWQPNYLSESFSAVIMAGGFGTRMRPLTDSIPKPMIAVNGRPMLEIIVEKLVSAGVSDIHISTHYLPKMIRDYFGDGDRFGVPIRYLFEDVPIGTAGALGLIAEHKKNTLIINGDVLTDLNFNMFLAYHLRRDSALTVATTRYTYQVPFGVINEKDGDILGIEEKPNFSFFVNSGIYLINKKAYEYIPKGVFFNMTDLCHAMIKGGRVVSSFPIFERWLDVGRPSDYAIAEKFFR
jgi:dTDP-glucose pyrophosphorylase